MGQAKSRGTYEERVAQASERKRAAYLKQCEERAARQQAESGRIREARESNPVVIVGSEPVRRRGAPSRSLGMLSLMGALALVAATPPPARDKEDELSKLARKMRGD